MLTLWGLLSGDLGHPGCPVGGRGTLAPQVRPPILAMLAVGRSWQDAGSQELSGVSVCALGGPAHPRRGMLQQLRGRPVRDVGTVCFWTFLC